MTYKKNSSQFLLSSSYTPSTTTVTSLNGKLKSFSDEPITEQTIVKAYVKHNLNNN